MRISPQVSIVTPSSIKDQTSTLTRSTPSLTNTETPIAYPPNKPEDWQSWPVLPKTFSSRLNDIYFQGQSLGNDAHAYSKIGDCDSSPTWFLGVFDGKKDDYSLGEYGYLQRVIDYFHGSHSRTSLAAGNGYSTANILTTFMADRMYCYSDETPLDCEIRNHRPAFAFVSIGSNDIYHLDAFVKNMRHILNTLIGKGVIPILASKADNLEGDHRINFEIAKLAYEYNIPFWNFWLAVQPLPSHGLQEDGAHLTWAGPFFDDPIRMRAAWPWRNLTALQVLDAVWMSLGNTAED